MEEIKLTVKISKRNSKLGVIPSVNLPPILTCRPRCPCARDCYATKGHFRFKNVRDNLESNYRLYLDDPRTYFTEIKHAINDGLVSYSYFRWHAAGDFVDKPYFEGVVKVAEELPRTSFLAFTKKFELVNEYIATGGYIPDNLHIVFSAWGDDFQVDNPYHFPVAYVRFESSENKSIPETAVECSGDCTSCLRCWNIKSGESVVFDKH